MQTRNTNSRPSDILVQKAKERKRNSEEQCTESRQLTSEQKWTNKNLKQLISYINSMDFEKLNHSNEQM